MAVYHLLYRTATAGRVPAVADMPSGRLAVNTADERLYFRNSAGAVVEPQPRSHTHPWAQVTNREATALSTQNLNDVTTPGTYYMNSNAGATAELNYPVLLAGLLTVETAVSGNVQCTQRYTTNPSSNPRTFVRLRFGTGLLWGNWFELARYDQAMTHTFLTAATDANSLTSDNTWYSWGNATIMTGGNWPPTTGGGGILEVNVINLTNNVTQTVTLNVGASNRPVVFRRSGAGSPLVWKPWQIVEPISRTQDLPSADAGDVYVDGDGWYTWSGTAYIRTRTAKVLPTSSHDLNTYTVPDVWWQNQSSGATLENNYPAAGITCFLEIQNFGNATLQTVTSRTSPYRSWWRLQTSASAWSGWKEVADMASAMTHVFNTSATDANTMIADNTFYTWTASSAVGANFPAFTTSWPAAGYMRVYYAAATQVTQELTFIVTGQKSRTFTRFGNTSTNAWQPWKSTSDWSSPTGLPSSDMGDIYVDGQGVYRWNGSAYALSFQDGTPIGTVVWWPLRSSVPAGYLVADGQTVSRATYPDLTAMVGAGTVPTTTEATWNSTPTRRGAYTLGNGTTTIRLPDYNGKSSGTLGRVFLSGDGTNAADANGTIQQDAMQRIQGSLSSFFRAANVTGTGPLRATAYGSLTAASGTGGVDNATISFDSALAARTDTTTYPTNVSGCFIIKSFGAVVNPGSANAAQLASDYAVLNAKVQSLYSGGVLNLADGGLIKAQVSSGAWSATNLGFQAGSGETFVQTVPGTTGTNSGFIARHAASANNAYISIIQTPGGDGHLQWGAQGTAANGNLVFVNNVTQIGAAFGTSNGAGGGWMFGPYVAPSLAARVVINYVGGGTQFGSLYRPTLNDTTPISFQNAAGAGVGSVGTSATATTFNTSSDRRLKRDITPIDPMQALESVMHLIPCNWIWRTTGTIGEGFIADEFQVELPDYVQGEPDGDGYQQLDKTGAIARMVGAIQALNSKIETQNEILSAQHSVIEQQQDIIDSLEHRLQVLEAKANS